MKVKQVIGAAVAGMGLLGAGFWFGSAAASTTEPGSTADPLVSKSYVDQLVARLADKAYVDQAVARVAAQGIDKTYVDQAVAKLVERAYVDTLVQNLAAKTYVDERVAEFATQAQVNGKTLFQVVNVPKGSSLIAEAGTEFVLRGGKGSIIDSEKGGVLDATSGEDLRRGQMAPPNHLLVIPVSDGRGLLGETDMILIVKGTFTVKAPGQ